MKNYGYIGTYSYSDRPISAWGYVGYSVLWAIPVIGWIFWLCAALWAINQNKKNYARSYVCGVLMIIFLALVAVAAIFVADLAGIDLVEMLGIDLGTTAA